MPEGIAVLVVPCFNEADRFRATEFSQALKDYPGLGFLFVDDGSRDATQSVLENFVKSHSDKAALLSLTANKGKAEAVREGFLKVLQNEGPWTDKTIRHIGYWDADLATPFSEFPRFLEVFAEYPRLWLVMGARVNLLGRAIRRHAHRHYLGRVFATAASFVLRLPVYDTQCGAKIFVNSASVRALFAKPFIGGWIFDVELLARLGASLKGERPHDLIYEIPLKHWQDVAGSKIKAKDFIKATFSLVRIARLYPRN